MVRLQGLLDRRAVRAALLVAVVALGAGVRLRSWTWVFGEEQVRLVGDGDPLYHVLQAERLMRDGLASIARDPALNHPLGADVLWPPLFDVILAGSGWVAAGGEVPDRPTLEAAAAVVPAAMGALAVLLVAFLGSALLGGRPWIDAAFVLALLPTHATMATLGRPDQHALEVLLLGLVILGAAGVARGGTHRPAALLALGVALSFWNWNGSALYLALVAGSAAAAHVLSPKDDAAFRRTMEWLAGGLAAGALLLVASVGLLGPAGALRTARIAGLSGLQPALIAGAAAACGMLAAARRWRPGAALPERLATAAGALLLPVGLLAALPWTRDGIGGGVAMLAARGWYESIIEFQPLISSDWSGGWSGLGADLVDLLQSSGFTLVAVLAAAPIGWRRWRSATSGERGALLLFLTLAGGTLVLTLARRRFAFYLSVAEALATALAAREVVRRIAARAPDRARLAPAAGVALVAVALAPTLTIGAESRWTDLKGARYAELAPVARVAARMAVLPGREAVLSPWSLGHDVRYFTGRPVICSPFGVDGGAGALAACAAFLYATDEARIEAVLAERRVGFVLVHAPLDEAVSLASFAPSGSRPVVSGVSGPRLSSTLTVRTNFRMLAAARLWLWDGMWGEFDGRPLADGPAALGAFRLVSESQAKTIWQTVGVPTFKLFQVVPGERVRVRGAAPRQRVVATTTLRTTGGRVIEWATHDFAGEDGAATLRLPYSVGANGTVLASPWLVTDGRRTASVAPSDVDVVLGASVEVSLGR
jgi:dolichyl-diphosphooligosaccharide--protein glycosyltransferase